MSPQKAPLLLLACLAMAPAVRAQTYSEPLGIGLETVPYSVPVRFQEFTVDGQLVRMAYQDVATGMRGQLQQYQPRAVEQPVVVLLHGKNFNGYYWAGPIKFLAEAGYRVIVPDQVGFGKSSKPDVPYSFETMAKQTAGLLDALRIDDVSVVGHSMGGMLAVKFARLYPERVQRLILENPIGLEDYRKAIPPVPFEKVFADELAKTDAAKTRAFFKRYFVTWKPEYEKYVELQNRPALSGEWPRLAKASALTYQTIYEQPVRQEFSKLQVPTLLIIGQEDRTVVGKDYGRPEATKDLGNYPELGRAAARDITRSKLVELPNVGHIPHLEAPAEFQTALLSFLRG